MKNIIRQEVLDRRQSLDGDLVKSKSTQIHLNLSSLDFYKECQCIMLYVSFRNEVSTNEIITELLKQKKRVFIPVTVPKTKALIVSELKNVQEDLEVRTFGVLEPKKEALRPVSPDILDLVIVPGVAFDERGYRIGYGAGYYDRFLPNLRPHVPTVAISFELQMVEHVENDHYDFPVQYIITEDRILHCKSSNVD